MRIGFFLLAMLLFLRLPLTAQNNYFQQEVHYKIQVRLDDKQHFLHARLNLDYINRSPDTLQEIWIHLWPNAYSSRNTALGRQLLEDGDTEFYFSGPAKKGYIDSLNFTSEGRALALQNDPENPDVAVLKLNSPLYPGQRLRIETPFRVKIPDGRISRLGHIGQAYAVTQWYPKPVVYDRDGWHPMPYLGQGEFYSEFGSFEVEISLPRNYIVGATGELQTASEIAFMDELERRPKKMVNDMRFPPSDTEIKTIVYRQDSIHDFAWFADKRFQVAGSEVRLPHSGRKVKTRALFTPAQAELWQKATEYLDSAVYYYSLWVGDYPYSTCTAVDGNIAAGGGMEYPMVTIIGSVPDAYSLDIVIAHEVGHNWFYGILGSDEREHPWMDEGINSFAELRYARQRYPDKSSGNQNELSALGGIGQKLGTDRMNALQAFRFEYGLSAKSHSDQAVKGQAEDYSSINYGTIVYRKTALAFNYLRSFLGDAVFDSAMHAYFNAWKFRHPGPDDIQYVFEKESGKELGWFFDDLLNGIHKQDFRLGRVERKGDSLEVKIKERSGLRSPVHVSFYRDKKEIVSLTTLPFTHDTLIRVSCPGCNSIVADPAYTSLDLNQKNNIWNSNKLFRRLPGSRLSLLPRIDAPEKEQVYFTPLVAWNDYDRWMPGLYLHNRSLPFRKLEFDIAPLFSISTGSLNGMAGFDYTIGGGYGFVEKMVISNRLRRFTYDQENYLSENGPANENLGYIRYQPALQFFFRPGHARSPLRQLLTIESVHLWEDRIRYFGTSGAFRGQTEQEYTSFYRLSWDINNRRTLDPYRLRIRMETNDDLLKTDVTLHYRFSYKKNKKGADFHLFAGYAFVNDAGGQYGYFLSDRNGVAGSNDYAYDHLYLGRSATEGILFNQMAVRQGGFRVYTPLGAYKDWILSLNSTIDFPAKLPLAFFFDIGTTEGLKDDLKNAFGLNQQFSYGGGLCLRLIRDAVEVYFPLFRSTEIQRYLETNDKAYREQIRFVFDLSKLNPLPAREGIHL